MTARWKQSIMSAIVAAISLTDLFGHPGAVDAQGGHHDGKIGVYHFHHSNMGSASNRSMLGNALATTPFATPTLMPGNSSAATASTHATSASIATYQAILGNWQTVATNPAYAKDNVIVDAGQVEFRADWIVTQSRSTNGPGIGEVKNGSYRITADGKVVITYNLGKSGIQEEYWRIESQGLAKFCHWKNLSMISRNADGTSRPFEYDKDELFVKMNSAEHQRRTKVKLWDR